MSNTLNTLRQQIRDAVAALKSAMRDARAVLREVPAARGNTVGKVLVGVGALLTGAGLLLWARRNDDVEVTK